MNHGGLAFDRCGASDRAAVLLLHPIATRREIWSMQIPVFATHFDVLALDLPGHGRSPLCPEEALEAYAQQVLATLDEAGIGRVAVVGLSLGGMVAQALALQAPARVAALVLANTSGQAGPAVRSLWQQRLGELDGGGMAAQVTPTLQRWFTMPFRSQSSLTMDWVASMISATPPAGYRAAAHAICRLDFLAALAHLTAPTLIISGEADTAVAPEAAQALAAAIPSSRHVVLEGAPHLSSVENAAAFTELVGRFLLDVLQTSR